ncbi:hypothetical protein M405DRAFT_480685 [Rhizopogon salebrosus TDB-379]|nr:hypothetical protein M405DRAFT_480685 [Rhizopogon salebrosus TDB-379]
MMSRVVFILLWVHAGSDIVRNAPYMRHALIIQHVAKMTEILIFYGSAAGGVSFLRTTQCSHYTLAGSQPTIHFSFQFYEVLSYRYIVTFMLQWSG